MTDRELAARAREAQAFAYAPYSRFQVGAALLTKDGRVYTGCNIENASYTPTVCGERAAIFKAISEGVREFEAIAVVGGLSGGFPGYSFPCGVCRQVMTEFCAPDFRIILGKEDGEIRVYTLGELLPEAFTPDNVLGDGGTEQ